MHLVGRALPLLAAIALAASAGPTASYARPVPHPLFTSNGCDIEQPAVAFPNYNPLAGTDSTFTGSITATCTLPTELTIGLTAGGSNSFTQRLMKNGSATIKYNLYVSNGGAIFGDGTGTTKTQNVFSFITAGTISFYGDVPASQNVPAGTYSDTLQVTVTFVV